MKRGWAAVLVGLLGCGDDPAGTDTDSSTGGTTGENPVTTQSPVTSNSSSSTSSSSTTEATTSGGTSSGGGSSGEASTGEALRGTSIQFLGCGADACPNAPVDAYADRVRIPVDDPADMTDGDIWPADVRDDFTLELWIKGVLDDQSGDAGGYSCNQTSTFNWINGYIFLDRDIWNNPTPTGDYGASIDAAGTVAFGLSADGPGNDGIGNPAGYTICGMTDVLDGAWHHIAVTRVAADGTITLYVDGTEEATSGPQPGIANAVDYLDLFESPGNGNGTNESNPWLVFGAEKHDANLGSNPPFNGQLDEFRLSNNVRYEGASFDPPTEPFEDDANTLVLLHFDAPAEGMCETEAVIPNDGTAHANPANGDATCTFGALAAGQEGPNFVADEPFTG